MEIETCSSDSPAIREVKRMTKKITKIYVNAFYLLTFIYLNNISVDNTQGNFEKIFIWLLETINNSCRKLIFRGIKLIVKITL